MDVADDAVAVTALVQDEDRPKPRSHGPHGWLRFLVRRFATGVATLIAVSILIFAATNVLPGNVAQVVLGRNSNPTALHVLAARLDLNRSIISRYEIWMGVLVTGNLGNSAVAVAQGSPNAAISRRIGIPLRNSVILAAITTLILVPLSVSVGMFTGIRAGRTADHVTSTSLLVIGAFPEFVMGTLLILLFFDKLHLLPPLTLLTPGQSPLTQPDALILPVAALLGITTASCTRQVRSGMIRVLREDFVAMARLNGLPRRRVLWRYAARNALAPTVQIVAENIRYLLGSIIVVESVFDYPGIGTYIVNAVATRDVTEVEAAAIIIGAAYIAINIVADVVVVLLVPKLRTEL
jgi:peptide/nickel transport system permease protein